MTLSDSDSADESIDYDFSLSRLLNERQTRSKVRKEDLNDELLPSQHDGTSILNEEDDPDAETTMSDPRVAKVPLPNDSDATAFQLTVMVFS